MKRKLIVLSTILSLALSTTAFASTTFSDVPDTHWASESISALAEKGYISGVTTPVNGVSTFNPSGTISYGEVLSLATRLVAPEYVEIGSYLNSGLYDVENRYHWALDYYLAAYNSGMVDDSLYRSLSIYGTVYQLSADGSKTLKTTAIMNAPVTREEMAILLCSIAEVKGETLTETENIGYNIADYLQIEHIDEVKKVYSAGLMCSVNAEGIFNPDATLTRAEAATIFCRLMNFTDRLDVVIDAETDENGDVVAYQEAVSTIDANGVMTIYEGGYRYNSRLAQEGDIFVKLDGTSIVLKKDSNGVLAGGQGVAADKGMEVHTNLGIATIKHDSCVNELDMTDSLGCKLQSAYYWINSLTGEGHWDPEWRAITSQPTLTGNEYPFQLSEDMNWFYSELAGSWSPVYSNGQADILINNINTANGLS
ncbi:S-layer homology domain-containing protein [Chakrabartyella piscis]|uniref:S-layer homology domain-containing protein n=1 Tax=Chakrabartyella piscis TaxID=2918914 RepID=UPI002958A82B|nr:S-layer homology domain-containing protein [Chakrabartyella piscis]